MLSKGTNEFDENEELNGDELRRFDCTAAATLAKAVQDWWK